MAHLVVLGFDRLEQAQQVWLLGRRLRRENLLELADGTLAWRDTQGRVRVRRTFNPNRTAALGGAVCGGLVGAIFLAPLVGLGIGAGLGGLAGRWAGPGVDDDQVKRVTRHLQPGGAAIFALVGESAMAEIAAALRAYRPVVIMTSLPADRERDLINALRIPQPSS